MSASHIALKQKWVNIVQNSWLHPKQSFNVILNYWTAVYKTKEDFVLFLSYSISFLLQYIIFFTTILQAS